METILAFAAQVTQQASSLLMEYFKQKRLAFSVKLDQSLVTDADLAADQLISEAIHSRYPDDVIISEELHPQDLNDDDNQNHATWIIDPLDGSTNFRQGLHTWGVLLTRLVNGIPQEFVMQFPMLDETYVCQRGQGAFLNGNRIQVLQPDPEDLSSFFSCCSRTHRYYQVRIPYKPRIIGSTGFSLCCVAGERHSRFRCYPENMGYRRRVATDPRSWWCDRNNRWQSAFSITTGDELHPTQLPNDSCP